MPLQLFAKGNQMVIEKAIRIEGMSCHHCIMAVTKELSKLTSVQIKEVRIGSALLAYEPTKVTPEQIAAAIAEAGYRAVV